MHLLRQLQRMQFGRKSEKLDPDQFALALEDIEQAEAANEAADDKRNKAAAAAQAEKRRANRGALPVHLPRVHVTIEPADRNCPCCRSPMHAIGADVSERLDVVPAQFRVLVTHRPKYACRACEETVVQAPAPERLIKGGLPTEAMVASVLVSKYAWHLPLYRQAQMLAAQSLDIKRSVLAFWVGYAAAELRPVYDRLRDLILTSGKVAVDETKAPVLDPGRGRVKEGYFWAVARDREALEKEVIAALYAIEKTIRGASADERRRVRQEKSKPLVMAFRPWLEHQLARVSGKSEIAEELRYGLNHWEGLVRFLDDGRIELDTNIVERGIRPIVLNRKNALFAGHDEGAENWACVASLIETCKLNDVEPQAYIADVLDKLVNLWPASRIDELMPGHGPKLTPSIDSRPDALAQSQPPNAVGREDRLRPKGSLNHLTRLIKALAQGHGAEVIEGLRDATVDALSRVPAQARIEAIAGFCLRFRVQRRLQFLNADRS